MVAVHADVALGSNKPFNRSVQRRPGNVTFIPQHQRRPLTYEHEQRGLVSCMARSDVSEQQGVWHAHIHVIPRYKGDVPNPRGGVRGVIPFKASYLDAGPRPPAADKC